MLTAAEIAGGGKKSRNLADVIVSFRRFRFWAFVSNQCIIHGMSLYFPRPFIAWRTMTTSAIVVDCLRQFAFDTSFKKSVLNTVSNH